MTETSRSKKQAGSGRVLLLYLWLSLTLVGLAFPFRAGAQITPELAKNLRRIFADKEFDAKSFGPARWLAGGDAYTTLEPSADHAGAKDIVRYETANAKREVLVTASQLVPAGSREPLKIEDYAWSGDGKRVLIFTNAVRVWRSDTRGDYWVLDRDTGKLKKLGADAPASSLLFAKFSPDGARVAYVRTNNIYAEDLQSGKITPLTQDGSEATINGTSDWVYEEEFDVRDGFRWSPDGQRVAYWQFNTREVQDFPLIYYTGRPHEVVTHIPYPCFGVYPVIQHIPYPQPGTTNSAVRIGVVSAAGGPTRWMEVPGEPRDNYIARLEWAGNSHELVLEHLNRLQNTNDVLLANADTGAVQRIFRDQDKAWVEVVDDLRWIRGGKELLWLSEQDGWRHVYAISRQGSDARRITSGEFRCHLRSWLLTRRTSGCTSWLHRKTRRSDTSTGFAWMGPHRPCELRQQVCRGLTPTSFLRIASGPCTRTRLLTSRPRPALFTYLATKRHACWRIMTSCGPSSRSSSPTQRSFSRCMSARA